MTLKQKKVLKWIGLALASALVFWLLSGGNLWFVFVLMLMIGLHEYGHLLAAKWVGVKTAGFYFIPLGGISLIKENPPKQWKKFIIAYGGPLMGLALCIPAAGAWLIGRFDVFDTSYETRLLIGNLSLEALSVFAVINLFNLLPIYPFDGGRLLAAIHINHMYNFEKPLLYMSWILLVAVLVLTRSPTILFLCLIGVYSMYTKNPTLQIGKLEPDYYPLNTFTKKDMVKGYALYLGLIAAFIACVLVPYYV